MQRVTPPSATTLSNRTNFGSEGSTRIQCLRRFVTFLLGLVLGFLLWKLAALNFTLGRLFVNRATDLYVFLVFVLVTGTIFMLSLPVRAVILLIFVALVGKSGRTYLRAVAFAFIISGPIANLVENAGEVPCICLHYSADLHLSKPDLI
ncbi:GM25403 [Drosophila sechellia]|uniref:GM25403 n=1 Tax=Drosophila sechellia TaxID=7238 RepID=B4HGQ1_DROSE|nr:GM25403 [Drosophila sechellia]